jgi:hypothetical protein
MFRVNPPPMFLRVKFGKKSGGNTRVNTVHSLITALNVFLICPAVISHLNLITLIIFGGECRLQNHSSCNFLHYFLESSVVSLHVSVSQNLSKRLMYRGMLSDMCKVCPRDFETI